MTSRTAALAASAALLLSSGCSSPGASGAPPAPEPAPAVVLSPLVGKPPPPIQVARWVQGEPLARFEPGKVYVVDFWATWCGPCKAAIPHLTRLAHEHAGNVEVIGVSISEHQSDPGDTAYIEAVASFVQSMGERMDYRVAVDTPAKTMHATWFKPARTGGIPTAYVIDQKGLVAWVGIGSPPDVERVVGEVLAGTFDPRKEAERKRAEDAAAEERSRKDIEAVKQAQSGLDARYPGYSEAMARGDSAAALASLDAAFRADPSSETGGAYQWKLMLLLSSKTPDDVTAYARDLLARHGDDEDIVGFLSAVLVSTSEDVRFDPQLAFTCAERTAARAKPDSRWAQFAQWRLGWAWYHVGDREKAIASVQSALDGVARLKAAIDFEDLEDECRDALRVFRK
jgi:thiol-disulfide isomerase/thioredoxin